MQSKPAPNEGLLTGTLAFDGQGCLRVNGYTVLLPPGVYWRDDTLPIRFVTVEARVETTVAQLGAEVRLRGTERDPGDYRYFENKVQCAGPYWGVAAIVPTADQPIGEPSAPSPTALASPARLPSATEPPATSTPQPATATPVPPTHTPVPTATVPPAACAHAWFMPNSPPGCPDQPTVYAHTIAQRFERGLLLWRAIPDTYGSQIYAFFADGQWPAWNPTNDRWRQGLPESDPAIIPPAGFYQPVRGFGLFWREAFFNPAGSARDRLGWAVEPEYALGECPLQCRVQGDWAAGCFLGGPGGQVLLVEGNNAWSTWAGPSP